MLVNPITISNDSVVESLELSDCFSIKAKVITDDTVRSHTNTTHHPPERKHDNQFSLEHTKWATHTNKSLYSSVSPTLPWLHLIKPIGHRQRWDTTRYHHQHHQYEHYWLAHHINASMVYGLLQKHPRIDTCPLSLLGSISHPSF